MLTMSMFSYLFGISSNELSTWQRRGHPSLVGVRGREREFTADDRDAVLRVVFAKALATSGKTLEEAFALAGEWVELENGAAGLPEFYVFNPLTLAGGLVGSDAVSAKFMAAEWDNAQPASGWAGFSPDRPLGKWLFGVALTALNLREIVSRVDMALAGQEAMSDEARRSGGRTK